MKKKIIGCVIVSITVIMFLSSILFFAKTFDKGSIVDNDIETIITLSDENGTLTDKQLKSLNSGANINYNGNIYRLQNTYSDKKVYIYRDLMLTATYINVDNNGTYAFDNGDGKEYVDFSILERYLTTENFQNVIKNYLNSSEVKNAINNALLSYVSSSQLNQLCTRIMPVPGTSFHFENGCAYLTFCLDADGDVTDFYMIGGTKAGSKGQFALTFCETPAKSITVFQTGSIVLSDLAKTSDGSTGIRPGAMNSHLVVFRLGGKTVN